MGGAPATAVDDSKVTETIPVLKNFNLFNFSKTSPFVIPYIHSPTVISCAK